MKIKKSERNKGIIALLLLAFVFASMGLFVRYLQNDFTIIQQTYLRIFAAFILGIVLFYKDLNFNKLKKIPSKEWFILFIRSVTLYCIAVTLLSYAYTTTKYSNVSFIGALPIVELFGFILLKEKFTLQKALYVALGFVGVLLIAVQDYSNIFNWGQGEIFALVASVSFAISYIARKWQSDLLNNKEIAVIIFFISTLLLIPTSFLLGEGMPNITALPYISMFVLIIAGLFNVINLFLTNYGFQKIEAVLAGNLLMLEVVFAVALGFMFYGEIPLFKELLGGLLVVISAYQMNKLSSS